MTILAWTRRLMLGAAGVLALSTPVLAQEPVAPQPVIAATPPMGWNPYNVFGLNYGEKEVMAQADLLVKLGLADLGYRYVNIDDGWWLRRTPDTIDVRTSIYPSARLPDGTTSLRPFVEQLHARKLKAGIYTDIGLNTCSQRWVPNTPNLPVGSVAEREVGTYGHHAADAALLFAQWGFDFIKIDACGVADYGPDVAEVKQGKFRAFPLLIVRERPDLSDAAGLAREYASFAEAVRRAVPERQPLISICAWGQADVNDWADQYSQMWRTSFDISANWKTMLFNFDSAASRALFAGPGRWNDPDMLEIGNGEFDQNHLTAARAHMSLWAVIAAPLILGNDLRRMSPDIAKIVGNREVIAINQDPAGNQGVVLSRDGDGEILAKALSTPGHKAIAFVNRGSKPLALSVALADVGLASDAAPKIVDLWGGVGAAVADGRMSVQLAPQETRLLRVEGRPSETGVERPADMPARFHVADTGYKASDRTPARQWVLAQIGFLPFGQPLLHRGRQDHAGLGVAAGSKIRIDLDGRYASVKLTPRMIERTNGRYEIRGDGRLLAQGDVSTVPRERSVDVQGIRTLELIAPAAAAGATMFAWHDVRFLRGVRKQ